MEWTPLEDEYDAYRRHLDEQAIEGLLQDPEDAQRFGYPRKLNLTDNEKEHLAVFVKNRLDQAFETFNAMGGVHPAVLGQLFLDSILSGMMWEYERIG
jgi:hypothetical protein